MHLPPEVLNLSEADIDGACTVLCQSTLGREAMNYLFPLIQYNAHQLEPRAQWAFAVQAMRAHLS